MILGGYEPRAYQQRVIDLMRHKELIQQLTDQLEYLKKLRLARPVLENGQYVISLDEVDMYIATTKDILEKVRVAPIEYNKPPKKLYGDPVDVYLGKDVVNVGTERFPVYITKGAEFSPSSGGGYIEGPRAWLFFKLSLLRDKPYIWSRPIDWIRYNLLWKGKS